MFFVSDGCCNCYKDDFKTPTKCNNCFNENCYTSNKVFSKKNKKKVKECPICKETFKHKEKIFETRCNHWFHTDCINLWRDVKENCPMCRMEM